MQPRASDELVDINEAAELLDTSVRTVTRLQSDGLLEPIYQGTLRNPHARRRYRRADVLAIRNGQRVAS